ncbi:hypothetical protein WMY93_027820 [Mugilogobius chulae]|uniref:B box-type domain-containing protein n=1 Tax=Mugilogobius chulae TaxID=88201 RepID=A0AAW0N5Y4_9GOBI
MVRLKLDAKMVRLKLDAKKELLLCPEHEERLKLFCETDKRLACIICRDSEAHDGHKFKPIREAAASLRRDMDLGLANVESQISQIQKLKEAQSRALSKAKELSESLQSQIHRQFEAFHQRLRKREDEITNELRNKEAEAVQSMSQSLRAMERAEDECEEQKKSWRELIQETDPEKFLKRWSEEKRGETSKDMFSSRSEGLSVVQSPLFQGPFQSHLQFFMWKELLQVVDPKPADLTLRDDNPDLTVSQDNRSFHYAPPNWRLLQQAQAFGTQGFSFCAAKQVRGFGQAKQAFGSFDSYRNTGSLFGDSELYGSPSPVFKNPDPPAFSLTSNSEFSLGQHYWEVELGMRPFWCVGVTDYFLKLESGRYYSCRGQACSEVAVEASLRRLGVYLNCSPPGLSFYDADSMVRLVTLDCTGMGLPVSAFFRVRQQEPDRNPMSVCRY